MTRLTLHHSKSLQRGHPWIFSGALHEIVLHAGQIVFLEDTFGNCLATAYACPNAKIRLRVLQEGAAVINQNWWNEKVQRAISSRQNLKVNTDAFRLIHGESDGLPGIIVDYYNGYLCLQVQTEGIEPHLEAIIQSLIQCCNPKGIFERSDSPYRSQEGLKPRIGHVWGQKVPDLLMIQEYGLRYEISLVTGQKSGHYCDQRDNRHLIAQQTTGKSVLDLCCNSGGFGLQALKWGAKSICFVDSSRSALESVKRNYELNDLTGIVEFELLDVAKAMDKLLEQNKSFDCIILDPPKLAPQRSHLLKAERAYKDLNRRAMKLLSPKGELFSFSCSAAMTTENFQKVLAWAALDANQRFKRKCLLSQPIDHPIILNFPESEYLKGIGLVQQE